MSKKISKQRLKARFDPTAPNSSANAPLILTKSHEQIFPVLQQLNSPEPAIRQAACDALSYFFAERSFESVAELLVDSSLLRTLLPFTCDTNLSVCLAAVGAVRNLSQLGGDVVCSQLLQLDVLTFIQSQLNKLQGELRQTEFVLCTAITAQLLALTTNLCESNTTAMIAVCRLGVAADALRLLLQPPSGVGTGVAPETELQIEAASLLMVLTEDFPAGCQLLRSVPSSVESLVALAQSPITTAPLRVTVVGILYHLHMHDASLGDALLEMVVGALLAALELDPIEAASSLPAKIRAIEETLQQHQASATASSTADEPALDPAEMQTFLHNLVSGDTSMATDEIGAEEDVGTDEPTSQHQYDSQAQRNARQQQHREALQQALTAAEPWAEPLVAWRSQAMAVQTALELLTNICSLDETAEEKLETDTDWADDDVNENMSASQTNDFAGSSTVFSPAFVLAMHQNVVKKLEPRCTPMPATLLAQLSPLMPAAQLSACLLLCQRIAGSALTVLNNVVLLLPSSASGGLNMPALFLSTLGMCAHLSPTHDLLAADVALGMASACDPDTPLPELHANSAAQDNVMSAVTLLGTGTNLAWSLVRQNPKLVITKAQINQFINWARTGRTAAIRLHSVGVMNLLANAHQHDDYVFVFASVFVQLLTDRSLAVIIQTLDGLFDLFSEDGRYADTIQRVELIKRLSELLPVFTQQVALASTESFDREFIGQLRETRLNLARFIKYLRRTYK